jgi:hypothetical protein
MLLIGLGAIAACQEFDPPPINPTPRLDYPSGVVADFPHLNPGDTVTVAVRVTSGNGKPAAGVEVIWDDGFVTPSVLPIRSITDGGGIASGRWAVHPLQSGVFSQKQWVRALVPGAENSPLEFRATVIRCTRC